MEGLEVMGSLEMRDILREVAVKSRINDRELGIEGLDEFREAKHILIDYKIRDKDYWFPYHLDTGRKT